MKPFSSLPDIVRGALALAFVIQALLVLSASAMLDNGVMMRALLIAAAAYSAGAWVVIARRAQAPTRMDLWFLRWGTLALSSVMVGAVLWRE